ncbi:MAG TPA: SDR family oxidoreductase [Candidatus Competibacteraceae bacterium]|nr:SDR family oxidoreductase [Candidatus Competibacteraceae bacterium]HRZ06724.1 SDR family oxidoreductase [Candidatus Competibacteraceae bacterium]HSA45227.1 SDR family oxidoreductase [Candidatus Competibacteraceae bacterium]
MRNLLIIGATSAIAEATARRFAATGARFYLVGRNIERLAAIARDLEIRSGQPVVHESLNLDQIDQHPALLERISQTFGGIDIALIAHGTLPDQNACQQSVTATLAAIHTNALSVISLATLLANDLETRGRGTLIAISSVAGDRGRQSNYVYGAAKGMVSLFLQGLRNRLSSKGIQVITVKPGFVDTPMTAAFEKKGRLWAQPDQIAQGIVAAVERGRDEVYLPWFWRWIMLVILHLPEGVFKRLTL